MLSNWPRIKSLRDATKKMSKSDRSVLSRIELTDSADIILQKCKRAQSDSIGTISFDPEMRPGVSNLVGIDFTHLHKIQIDKSIVVVQKKIHDQILVHKFRFMKNDSILTCKQTDN